MTDAGKGPLRTVLGDLLRVAFPPQCIACTTCLGPTHEGTPLCAPCAGRLFPIEASDCCIHCGAVDPPRARHRPARCGFCEFMPDALAAARSGFRYSGTAGEVLRRVKYHRQEYAADWLVHLAPESTLSFITERAQPDCIVPVPLALRRELQRGFNQAESLAVALSRRTGIPTELNLLHRSRRTDPQARFHSFEERLENMRDAFVAPPNPCLQGRRVLLVDDVMTTGATVLNGAEALMSGGAARVYVWTALRAKPSRPRADAAPSPLDLQRLG